MNKKINVLSLFDGISCAQVALDRLGYECTYYASEIDPYAIQVTQKNYPNTIQLGDVRNIDLTTLPKIDLLIGGSPCQDLSALNRQAGGLNGSRSSLFFEYSRILNCISPRYFVLENVNSMDDVYKKIISETLTVNPIMIDASLVSAQSRKRLFWTNVPNVSQPTDMQVMLQDIIESGIAHRKKSKTVRVGGRCSSDRHEWDIANTDGRRYSALELERLQSLDDNYTICIPTQERYKCIGNAFNVNVVKHILGFIQF